MALDKSRFDEFLKANAWRDLAFRAAVWFAISGAAAYLALHKGIRASQFLERVVTSVAPLVNLVGTFAVLLAMPALALKDLEAVAPGAWGQGTRRGRVGGFVRRLAGDLLLWTLGAFATVLSAIAVAAWIEGISRSDVAPLGLAAFKVALLTATTALLSVGVRRAGPSPIVDLTERVNGLISIYAVVLGVTALGVMRSA